MSAIRRLYFYVLSLISALVVVWGAISVLQTLVAGEGTQTGSQLATGLSLVLVGLPIFILHWRVAQGDAARDGEERASRVRSVFLYAAQAATLGPLVFQVLYLLNRGLVELLGLSSADTWFGFTDQPLDYLIALLINLLALAYFWRVTRSDWASALNSTNLQDARRLYRYLWVLAGLSMTISAVYSLLRYLLELGTPALDNRNMLAGGLSLLIVGGPILVYTWRLIQSSLTDPAERHSLLRLVVLYAVSLAGVIGVLSTAGSMLTLLIRWILGASYTLATFLQENSGQIGLLIPLGIMWWYFGGILNREVAALSDQPRRAALRRLYYYILALLGLAVTYAGLIALSTALARYLSDAAPFYDDLQYRLSGALSSVLVGLPLWLIPWRLMQTETARIDDAGDHARRSVLRKSYLYLVLFSMVVGSMVFSGQLLYLLFNQVLSEDSTDFLSKVMEMVVSLVITAGLLVYHWRALRRDGLVAQHALGDLHRDFPVLILAEHDADAFATATLSAIQRTVPDVPVSMLAGSAELPAAQAPRAVVLPLSFAIHPPTAWQGWLDQFGGQRLAVPLPAAGWTWLGQAEKEISELALEAARAIRQMAEGEAVRQVQSFGPWSIFGYVLGGIGGLIVLAILFSVMTSALYR